MLKLYHCKSFIGGNNFVVLFVICQVTIYAHYFTCYYILNLNKKKNRYEQNNVFCLVCVHFMVKNQNIQVVAAEIVV